MKDVQCACSRKKKVLVIAFELVIGYNSDVIAIAGTGGVFFLDRVFKPFFIKRK
jgi:hypothetical protein